MAKLTVKQKKFADEYIKSGNATQSAIKAGYSKKTAQQMGSENLLKPVVKSYIDERLKKIDEASIASQKEILQYLTRVLREEETDQVVSVLKKPEKITIVGSKNDYEKVVNREVTTVTEITVSERDRMKAADLLLKVTQPQGNTDIEKAQYRKLNAEADMAEQKAKTFSADSKEVTVNIRLPGEEQDDGD